jgi:hypothetical protein
MTIVATTGIEKIFFTRHFLLHLLNFSTELRKMLPKHQL